MIVRSKITVIRYQLGLNLIFHRNYRWSYHWSPVNLSMSPVELSLTTGEIIGGPPVGSKNLATAKAADATSVVHR